MEEMKVDKSEIENAIISGMFLDEKMDFIDLDKLPEKYFVNFPVLFKKMVDYRKKKLPYCFHGEIVKKYFDKNEIITLAKGMNYFRHISNLPQYITTLKSIHLREKTVQCIDKINTTGNIDFVELQGIVKEFSSEINVKIFNFNESMKDYINYFQNRISGKIITYKFNIPELDDNFGKIYPGTSIIVGGRTSIGKSSLLLQFAYNIAKQDVPVLFISAEMSAEQLVDRIISFQTGIDLYDITNALIKEIDKEDILLEINELKKLKFNIYETSRFNEIDITKLINNTQAKVVFLDYIQRFALPESYDTRASAFSDIANGLKSIAKENNIVVISASQLSRAGYDKDGKSRKVGLQSLKESGGLEESADGILLLEETGIDEDGIREIVIKIAKNRQGRTSQNLIFGFVKNLCHFKFLKYLEKTHHYQETRTEKVRTDLY